MAKKSYAVIVWLWLLATPGNASNVNSRSKLQNDREELPTSSVAVIQVSSPGKPNRRLKKPKKSQAPSQSPTVSIAPTISAQPSAAPTTSQKPSSSPSASPTSMPSVSPSAHPTISAAPSHKPSISPSDRPSSSPSVSPTSLPSSSPSFLPTNNPTISLEPSVDPNGFDTTERVFNEVIALEQTCRPATPGEVEEVVVPYTYEMVVDISEDTSAAILEVEHFLGAALAEKFLSCNFQEGDTTYVHKLSTLEHDTESSQGCAVTDSTTSKCINVEGSLTYSVYKNNEGGRRRLDGDDDLLQQIYDAIAQALQELTANGSFGFIEALEVTGNFGLASGSDSGTFLTNGIIAGVMCGLVAISAVVIFAVWRKRKKMKYYDDSVAEGSAIEYYEEKEAHESFQMPREAYVVNEMEESVEVGSILRDLNTLKPAEPNSPSGIQFISTRPPRPASPDYQSTIEELAPVSPRSADPSYKVFDTVDL